MLPRILCCAFCALFVSPAFCQPPLVITEDTVIDYDVTQEQIEVRGGRLTVVDGGRLNTVQVFGGASASIVGGEIYGHFSTHPDSIGNLVSGGRINAADGLQNVLVTGGEFDYALLMSTTRFEGGVVHQADARSATVSGGTIDYVQVNDGLPFVVNGGSVGEIEGSFVLNGGSLEFGNGTLGWMGDDADLVVNGGTAQRIASSGTTLVSGGEVVDLDSTINQVGGHVVGDTNLQAINFWSGGTRDGVLYATRNAVLRVYGYELAWNGERLTGTLLDGSTLDNFLLASDGLRVVLNNGPQVPGDGDGDGVVGLSDLNGVRNEFGSTLGFSPFDVNFDWGVNIEDLNLVRNNFGNSIPQAVPEPSSLLISMVLLPMCLNTIRRSSRYCGRQ